jgi:hypothetical protein
MQLCAKLGALEFAVMKAEVLKLVGFPSLTLEYVS